MEINDYEPPKKMMKYDNVNVNIWKTEIALVQFKLGYVTKKGNILLENKKIEDNMYPDHNDEPEKSEHFKVYILHFQTFEGGDAYLISNTNTDIDINKGYTINEIFNNFINGYYKIGMLHHYYQNYYQNGIINDITTFDDDRNDEIRLHYTQLWSYKGNVAWRTITWDLFEDFVPKD
jgi:hypothetical protein